MATDTFLLFEKRILLFAKAAAIKQSIFTTADNYKREHYTGIV